MNGSIATARSRRRPSPELSRKPPRSNASDRRAITSRLVVRAAISHKEGAAGFVRKGTAIIPCSMSKWFRTYGFADVLDDLIVGAYPLDASDVAILSAMGVKRVLNLAEDQEYRRGERVAVAEALKTAGIEEQRVSMLDFGGLPAH